MSETAVDLKQAVINLESIATEADSLETSVVIRDKNGDEFKLVVIMNKWWLNAYVMVATASYPEMQSSGSQVNEQRPFVKRNYRGHRPGQSRMNPQDKTYSFAECVVWLATGLSDVTLLADTIKVRARNSSVKGPELKQAALEAWCEAAGVTPPSAKELKAAKQNTKNLATEKRKKIVEQLRSGEAGIKEWNSLTQKSKSDLDLQKLDLSGANLRNANFSNLDFSGANFSGANLTGANLSMTDAKNCNFNDAVFHDVNLDHFVGTGSTFYHADFKNVRGKSVYFKEAKLTDAIFERADFEYGQVHGAEFTGATFKDCHVKNMIFDAQTILPDDFKYWDDLQFYGSGIDPRKMKAFNESHAAKGLDFERFLRRLGKGIDKDRLKKSISMLKKESFELFSEVGDDSVTGIVKSQKDKDLVYSCRLTSDGHYSCCTQSLNVCGGLRGAICKHILVLILGLAKANELDPDKADLWARASALHKAKLDKDIASQTFLRFKGAEAGEIDWRPTETTPEDFYAF